MTYITLGWKLLEYKCMYYSPNFVHESWHKELTISDQQYDTLEAEYKKLCQEAGVKPSVTEYVDFPDDLPCGWFVKCKLSRPKGTPYDPKKDPFCPEEKNSKKSSKKSPQNKKA